MLLFPPLLLVLHLPLQMLLLFIQRSPSYVPFAGLLRGLAHIDTAAFTRLFFSMIKIAIFILTSWQLLRYDWPGTLSLP